MWPVRLPTLINRLAVGCPASTLPGSCRRGGRRAGHDRVCPDRGAARRCPVPRGRSSSARSGSVNVTCSDRAASARAERAGFSTECLERLLDDGDELGVGAWDRHAAVADHCQRNLGERPRIGGLAGHCGSAEQQLPGLRVTEAVEHLAEFGGERKDEGPVAVRRPWRRPGAPDGSGSRLRRAPASVRLGLPPASRTAPRSGALPSGAAIDAWRDSSGSTPSSAGNRAASVEATSPWITRRRCAEILS